MLKLLCVQNNVHRLVQPKTMRLSYRGFASDSLTPVSRKKKSNTIDEPLPTIYNFQKEYIKVKQEIRKAIQPLQPLNEDFEIHETSTGELRVQSSKAKFTFTADYEKELLIFISPLSGFQQYAYEPTEKLWLCIRDQHDLRGLIVRDFNRYLIGCPEF